MRLLSRVFVAAALVPLAACADAATPDARALSGTAPAGAEELLVIDADGAAFRATPAADGSYRIVVSSTRPVTLFAIEAGTTRALRVASTPGGAPDLTTLPAWEGEVSTAQLSTAGDDVRAEDNPLEQIDSDDDGESDLEDDDDDNDGVSDDDDDDDDDSGAPDDDEDLDSDDDGAPDLCDDDDDDDGVSDEDDADEDGDSDHDGLDDDDDIDDDNDGDDDDEDDDDDDDGIDDDEDEDDDDDSVDD